MIWKNCENISGPGLWTQKKIILDFNNSADSICDNYLTKKDET